MSEQYFLEKCITTVEDAKGSCTNMSHLSLDPITKQSYEKIVTDLTANLNYLNNRLKYLKQPNT